MKTDARHVDEENIQLLFSHQVQTVAAALASLVFECFRLHSCRPQMSHDASYQSIPSTDVSDVRSVQKSQITQRNFILLNDPGRRILFIAPAAETVSHRISPVR